MNPWVWSIIAIIAFLLIFYNRSVGKRVGEDIDEIRNSLYELRMSIKSLRADWNLKHAQIQVHVLKMAKKIPDDRDPYFITRDCIACGSCVPECPTNAITESSIFEIDPGLCIACAKCAKVCPVGACVPLTNIDT